jgi:hypothetical protein
MEAMKSQTPSTTSHNFRCQEREKQRVKSETRTLKPETFVIPLLRLTPVQSKD